MPMGMISMNSRNKQFRITVESDMVVHKKLKTSDVVQGTSMRDDKLAELPNDETIQAIEEVVNRKDLIYAEDAEDLFDKLGV